MPNRWIVRLKVLAHMACIGPLAWLAWLFFQSTTSNPAALGPDPTETLTFFTGFGALRLIVISLAVSPIRKLIPKLSWIIRFRRMLGLYAFLYSSLHLLIYLGLYSGWSWPIIADDLAKRPYIWAGFTAWVLMVPLAFTSTTWSIRKLGGKRWNWLHQLVYITAIAGVLHYWWIVKTGVLAPLQITLVLAALLLMRPMLSWWKGRKTIRPAAATAA